MISINNLSKTYSKKVEVLKDINLKIQEGEIVVLLGHNGSGKSTLIKCIVGVLKSTSGNVEIDNKDVYKDRTKVIANMGVVFNQKPSFIVDLSVYDNLLFFKAIYELDDVEFTENLKLIDEYLHVSELFQKPYRKLSFGERVKCELTSVLLHSPRYIILDEPTIGLDYNAKKGLYELLLYLNRKQKVTIIIVTHEVDYIEKICTRAIILKHGEVQYDGTPEKIGKFLRHSTQITIKYESIRDWELAREILGEAESVDNDKQMFTHNIFSVNEKNIYIDRVNKAFNILEITTGTASLREVFENALQEVQGNK